MRCHRIYSDAYTVVQARSPRGSGVGADAAESLRRSALDALRVADSAKRAEGMAWTDMKAWKAEWDRQYAGEVDRAFLDHPEIATGAMEHCDRFSQRRSGVARAWSARK